MLAQTILSFAPITRPPTCGAAPAKGPEDVAADHDACRRHAQAGREVPPGNAVLVVAVAGHGHLPDKLHRTDMPGRAES